MSNLPPRYAPQVSTAGYEPVKLPQDQAAEQFGVNTPGSPFERIRERNYSRNTADVYSREELDQVKRDERREKYLPLFHARYDRLIRQALADLSILPGCVKAAGGSQTSPSSETRIPVGDNGQALGDTAYADLLRRASRAKSLQAKGAVLAAIHEELDQVRITRKTGWADRGTLEGRMLIAREARRTSRREAAIAFDITPRTVTKYLAELRKQEERKR